MSQSGQAAEEAVIPGSVRQTGNMAAEIPIVSVVYSAFALYSLYYFFRHRFFRIETSRRIDLWTTALLSRFVWQDVVTQDEEQALLGVHTMRNLVMATTLLAMALSQIISRIYAVIGDPRIMEQYERYANADPIAKGSFAAPEVKLGIALAILIFSFIADAESARLAVHMGFLIRVTPGVKGKRLYSPLRSECKALTQRASIWFTTCVRLLFLHFITYSWLFGVTAFLIFSIIMLLLLAWSDYVPSNSHLRPPESSTYFLSDDRLTAIPESGHSKQGKPPIGQLRSRSLSQNVRRFDQWMSSTDSLGESTL